MNEFVNEPKMEIEENVVAGIVGAFLFALVGGVAYFVLNLAGYIASLSGLIGAVCAVKGYSLFAKAESKKGIIIAAVISLLVIVLAWFLCLVYDVYTVYQDAFEAGAIDYPLSFSESIDAALWHMEDPEISGAYLKDLGLGVLFWLLGSGSFIFNKLKNAGKPTAAPQNGADVAPDPLAEEANDTSSLE